MPLIVILVFALIFNEEPEAVLKIGYAKGDAPLNQVEQQFLQTQHLQFVEVDDLAAAIVKVERHQLDLLLEFGQPARYWLNDYSAKGSIAEKLLQAAFAEQKSQPQRELVSGRDVRYVDWVMPGILSMNMMFSCLWGVGWVVVRYRKNGVLRRLQATPLSPLEFLSAQVFTRLFIVALVTSIVYFGSNLFIDFVMRGAYLTLFLVFMVGGACLTSVGLLVATRFKSEEVADGFLNLLSWPMLILSGVWFSLDGTTEYAQAFAQILPLTHVVTAARAVMIDGSGIAQIWPELAILLAITAFLMMISAKLFKWN